jgi:hypothetical protein
MNYRQTKKLCKKVAAIVPTLGVDLDEDENGWLVLGVGEVDYFGEYDFKSAWRIAEDMYIDRNVIYTENGATFKGCKVIAKKVLQWLKQ